MTTELREVERRFQRLSAAASTSDKVQLIGELLGLLDGTSVRPSRRDDEAGAIEALLTYWAATLALLQSLSIVNFRGPAWTLLRVLAGRPEFNPARSAFSQEMSDRYLILLQATVSLAPASVTWAGEDTRHASTGSNDALASCTSTPQLLSDSRQLLVLAFVRLPRYQRRLLITLEGLSRSKAFYVRQTKAKRHSRSVKRFVRRLEQYRSGKGPLLVLSRVTPPPAPQSASERGAAAVHPTNGASAPALFPAYMPSVDADAIQRFQAERPAIFGWCSTSAIEPDDAFVHWSSKMLADPEHFSHFLFALMGHVASWSPPPVVWAAVPGYLQLIQLFLPLYEHAVAFTLPATAESRAAMEQVPAEDHAAIQAECERLGLSTARLTYVSCAAVFDAGCRAALDPMVLQVLLDAVWENTAMHSSMAVSEGTRLADMLLTTCCSTLPPGQLARKGLAEHIDMERMLYVLGLLLTSEIGTVVERGLNMVYKFDDCFVDEWRERLVLHLLLRRDVFLKLFTHWTTNVRKIFIFYLVYKVLPAQRRLQYGLASDRTVLGRPPPKLGPIGMALPPLPPPYHPASGKRRLTSEAPPTLLRSLTAPLSWRSRNNQSQPAQPPLGSVDSMVMLQLDEHILDLVLPAAEGDPYAELRDSERSALMVAYRQYSITLHEARDKGMVVPELLSIRFGMGTEAFPNPDDQFS